MSASRAKRPGLSWPRLLAMVLLLVQGLVTLELLEHSAAGARVALVILMATAVVVMLDIAKAGDDRDE